MKIPVIVGPTCIGKTSLALEIAKQVKADILSIDSRQVFKNLDIGTGKYKGNLEVKKGEKYWEVEGVKIWGYDLFLPNEDLNVLKYCEFAREVISNYQKEGKKLIATCGTGFYLDFLSGNIEYNEIDEERKSFLHNLSLPELQKLYSNYNLDSDIDNHNKLRLITKLLSLESGNSSKKKFELGSVNFINFYLSASREVLYSNADKFTEEIFNQNVIQEFEQNFNLYGDTRAINGLIYKDIKDFKEGRILFDKMKSQIKFSLHAYIRRQQTYFKKMKISYSSFDRKDITEKITNLF